MAERFLPPVLITAQFTDCLQRLQVAGLALVVFGFLASCKRPPAPTTDGRSPVLHLGYTAAEEGVADREEASRALAGYLTRTLGVRVELVRTASYGPAVEAMARGEIDVISLAPFAYVLAAQRGVAEALVVTGNEKTGPRTYQSALITHRRTGLTRLADVPARAATLRFNFTDPASNSGHLVPQARLAALGLIAERDFAATEFTLSHNVAVLNVAFGKADLAGVSAPVLRRLIARGRVPADEIMVLWTSEPLPLGPVAARPALPAALKNGVRRALLELATREPTTARVVMAQYQEPNLVYLAGDDTLYAGLRRLAQSVSTEK